MEKKTEMQEKHTKAVSNDRTIVEVNLSSSGKLRRRSSIFKPKTMMESFESCEHNYIENLKKEIMDWKNLYAKTKEECLSLGVEPKLEPTRFDDGLHAEYSKKVRNFCTLVNKALEVHENLINYKNEKIRELDTLSRLTNKALRKSVHLD
ncbi:hypothetical protein PPYR_00870 [Photinus pyralis]|uniref:Uncharacterized protein n=1 Tax=Photinus pyralis TaxID=7054 RepID=A0A1Y1K4H3_PHOPY|nr:uncharacterized protein LOC116171953 [Photinus pyralis]KAB0803900.1 hypothetical protein PPYR_00870 [Photinus pyralis]